MCQEALARMRDVVRLAMDKHGHDVKEAIEEISRIRDKRVNGHLLQIPIRSFEHYIAWTDSDLRQPGRAIIRAMASYAGDLDLEKILAGRYYVEEGKVWSE
jgi:hypothetical protein